MFAVLTRSGSTFLKQTTIRNISRCLSEQRTGFTCVTANRNTYPPNRAVSGLPKPHTVVYEQIRTSVSSFLNKRNANLLWSSVASVSAAGRKRGRGKIKGRKIMRDLNKGQILGIGKENIQWPGLSAPIIRGKEIIQRQKLPKDEKYQESLLKMRERVFKLKKQKISPIDRGWTGGHPEGRKIGPPDPVGENTFEGFETVILQQKPVVQMTSHFGRYRSVSALCCTGNGQGLVGFGMAKAPIYMPALRRAKNRAGQRLMYIPRYEDRTIIHNFYSKFCHTKVYAWKQSAGYGLKCHRVIKSVCEMIGIKDLAAKVEGSTNTYAVLQAFLLGLLRQKSFDEISNEMNLHIVELSQDRDFFPQVVSSPSNPIESLEETPSFDLYLFDNKVFHRPPKVNHFAKASNYHYRLRRLENRRSHYDTIIKLRADHDNELKSFLTDKFPECKPMLPPWSRALKDPKKIGKSGDEPAS